MKKINAMNSKIIHFIGIGGIGTSGLAQFCAANGHQISGSNLGKTGIWPILEKIPGIKLYDVHDEKNVPEKSDAVVYSEAIPQNNVERVFARNNQIPEFSYFEFLGNFVREQNYRVIAVAGTHGKTTTTGLIAAGFMATGFPFSAIVGSTLREFGGSNFYNTKIPPHPSFCQGVERPWFLVEACEFRENFRFLFPEIVVLTNIDFDHADYFRDESHYFSAFRNFCQKAKIIIAHHSEESLDKILDPEKPVVFAENLGENDKKIELQIPGVHNRENAKLAIKIAEILGLDLEKFKTGLKSFSGAGRRQEFLGEKNGVKIFDDYGHHPTEIRATIAAFREKFPSQKIGLIFEPHQFSRTRIFFDDFVTVLQTADATGICPIYAARDTAADLVSVDFSAFIQKSKAEKIETIADVQNFIVTKKIDVLLFMGAGKISDFAHDFLRSN